MIKESWSWWVGRDEELFTTECGSRDEPDPIGTEPGDMCNRSAEPDFGQTLTSEAEMFNAPRHLGKSLYGATTGDDSEILPTSKPNLRRVRAR